MSRNARNIAPTPHAGTIGPAPRDAVARTGVIGGLCATLAALAALAPLDAAAQPADQRSAAAHGADLSGVWSGVRGPDDGPWAIYSFSEDPPELTDWGQARFDAAKPQRGPRGVPVSETDDLVYQCYPPGVPRIYLHPFPFEIVQTAGRVIMLFEYDHLVRHIYTDGREHRADLPVTWMGDAIGHWDGETLVVETTGFNDRTWLDRAAVPHSEALVLTERMFVNAEGLLQIDFRVEDGIALAEPWTFTRHFEKTDWTIEELVCLDDDTYTSFENSVLEFEPDAAGE